MSFDGQIFDKKITVREENSLTPKEVEIIPGGTADTKTTLVSSQTTNKTLTLPDLNDTLVGLAGEQTLTNKTLVVANNTITTAASGVISSTELNDVIAEVAGDLQTLSDDIAEVGADLQTHIDDPEGAHAASAISFSDALYPGIDNVQDALVEAKTSSGVTQQELEDHIVDTETHGVTGAIVGTTNTQTLTNKILTSPVINSPTGITKNDVGLNNVDNTSDATKNAAVAILANKTINGTNNTFVAIPEGALASTPDINKFLSRDGTGYVVSTKAVPTGVVVGTTDTQTLTNKTIDASANTLSSIPNSSLITDVADADKFLLRNSLGAVVSNTKSVPVGTVVGTTDSQILTNKAFGDAATFTQISTPSNPSAGLQKIYPKSDGTFYTLTSAGVESPLGSGGGGGQKNYLSTVNGVNGNGNFELGTTAGWNRFTTTLTGVIPSGAITITANSFDTFAATTSGKLAGAYSGLATALSSVSAGHGVITDAFTLDAEDAAKPFSFSFYYQLTGTVSVTGTSTNSFAVYLYDVANSAWIQPSNVYGMNQLTTIGKCAGEFQTSSNATSYRLAIVCVNQVFTATSIMIDDASVGPSIYNQGTPVTDLQDKGTITIGAITTPPVKGTTSIDVIRLGRIGDHARVTGSYKQTAAGSATTGSGDYLFTLPGGINFDSTKVNFFAGASIGVADWNTNVGLGTATVHDGTNAAVGVVLPYDATRFRIGLLYGAAGSIGRGVVSSGLFSPTNALLGFSFDFQAPILGWSSSVQMSDSADTRVVAARASITSAASTTANNPINFNTVDYDTHGAITTGTTTWKFTAPVPGYYKISGAYYSTTSLNLNVYKNGSVDLFLSITATSNPASLSAQIYLNAGDYIDFRPSNTATAAAAGGSSTLQLTNYIGINKLSGPSAIAMSERISARYTNTAGTVVTTSYALIPFATKDYDTHGAFSAGIFTAPAAGEYQVIVGLVGITPGSAETIVALYKNGSHYSRLADNGPSNGSTGLHGSDTVMLLAGETLGIYSFASSNNTLTTAAGLNHVTFRRVN